MIDDETSGSSSKMRYINAALDELPSLPLWHFSKCHRSLYTILVLTRPERTLESILLSAVCSFLLEPARLGASRLHVVELVWRYAAKHLIPKPRIVSSKEFTKQQSIHDATQFPSSKTHPNTSSGLDHEFVAIRRKVWRRLSQLTCIDHFTWQTNLCCY